jgi:hypothetical protein
MFRLAGAPTEVESPESSLVRSPSNSELLSGGVSAWTSSVPTETPGANDEDMSPFIPPVNLEE